MATTDNQPKQPNTQRFLALASDKKNRILNAAFQEFQYGYKKASTDAIVKKAGISKGLLFHYFGSKEKLYRFLMDYALQVMQDEYFDIIELGQRDILESIWQMAQLKEDITTTHPYIHHFMTAVERYATDSPHPELTQYYQHKQQALTEQVYSACDLSLFRADIDPKKALDIIVTSIENLPTLYDTLSPEDWNSVSPADHAQFLAQVQSYLTILRTCFYKQPHPKETL